MSDKTDDPREDLDLFTFAGLPEHSSVEHGTAKPAPSETKPDRNTRKQAPPRIFAEEMANERYLQDVAVAERYSICRQTVWCWAAKEALPEPIRLSQGVTRWRLSDLIAHERSRPRGPKANVVRRNRAKTAKAGKPL